VLAAPASAEGTWTAVAYSMSTDVKGFSWGYPIESGPDSAVAQRAVQECANHPLHPTDCRWLMSGKCVAIVYSPEFVQAGGGLTREEAERDARKLPPNAPPEMHGKPAELMSFCSEVDDAAPGGGSRP
jgi:hypothetical protein